MPPRASNPSRLPRCGPSPRGAASHSRLLHFAISVAHRRFQIAIFVASTFAPLASQGAVCVRRAANLLDLFQPFHKLSTTMHPALFVNMAEVGLHRRRRNDKPLLNVLRPAARYPQRKHLPLPRGKMAAARQGIDTLTQIIGAATNDTAEDSSYAKGDPTEASATAEGSGLCSGPLALPPATEAVSKLAVLSLSLVNAAATHSEFPDLALSVKASGTNSKPSDGPPPRRGRSSQNLQT